MSLFVVDSSIHCSYLDGSMLTNPYTPSIFYRCPNCRIDSKTSDIATKEKELLKVDQN